MFDFKKFNDDRMNSIKEMIVNIVKKEFPDVCENIQIEKLLEYQPSIYTNRIEFNNGIVFGRELGYTGERVRVVNYRFSYNFNKAIELSELVKYFK